MDDLKFNKSSLDSEDQQRDAFCHPPAERQNTDMPNAPRYSQRGEDHRRIYAGTHSDLCMVLSFMKAR